MPQFACVADTHIVLWMLQNSPRLSPTAKLTLQQAETTSEPVYISAMSLVEIRYLIEKGRFVENDYLVCLQMLHDPTRMLTLAPLDLPVADAIAHIPRTVVPEMPDRIIAATAFALGLPLISADTEIRKLPNLNVIW